MTNVILIFKLTRFGWLDSESLKDVAILCLDLMTLMGEAILRCDLLKCFEIIRDVWHLIFLVIINCFLIILNLELFLLLTLDFLILI